MPVHRDLDQDFFKKWSPEMAYVLGFFAADGSMILNKRGAHFIEFTITDRIILKQIKTVTCSTHKIQKRNQNNHKWKPQYRIQIGSKEWFADLLKLGFTQNKSKTVIFPDVPEKHFGNFVRGYFDGDGCVYFNTLNCSGRKKPRKIFRTIFTSGCEAFLKDLWKLLKEKGVQGGSLKNKTRGHELVFSHTDSVALYGIMYHTGTSSVLYLPRKKIKLERAIREMKVRS